MNPETFLKTVLGLVLRALLLLMGLVFLLSLLAAALLLLVWWGVRALWARLTGRPVQPLVFTLLRRANWQRFHPRASDSPAASSDVIDVESRPVDSPGADRLGR
jgi:membrane protein implicated in regulation of membrane protease activity